MKEEISPYELILKQMHMFTVVGRVKAPIYICSRVAALGSPSARRADQKTLIKHDRITQINLNLHPAAVIPDVLHFIFVDVPHKKKK